MIIIHDYWIDDKSRSDVFYVRSKEKPICPICENSLNVIGSRERGLIEHDGTKRKLTIRRLKCGHCNRIHHELPEVIVPYKRYSAETIEKSICGNNEEQACELSTIRSWKIWFYLLEEYFESTLKAIKFLYISYAGLQEEISLLQPLKERRKKSDGWLRRLVRIIVNSNRWVHTRFTFS
ncbi:MAG: DUF6431 domain-containing protein [Natronincolaceae bacterium]|jgi:hypothetical protein